jgi:hypothetical protein
VFAGFVSAPIKIANVQNWNNFWLIFHPIMVFIVSIFALSFAITHRGDVDGERQFFFAISFVSRVIDLLMFDLKVESEIYQDIVETVEGICDGDFVLNDYWYYGWSRVQRGYLRKKSVFIKVSDLTSLIFWNLKSLSWTQA